MYEIIDWQDFTRKSFKVKAFQFKKETLYHGIIYPAGAWLVNDGQTVTVLPDNTFKSMYE